MAATKPVQEDEEDEMRAVLGMTSTQELLTDAEDLLARPRSLSQTGAPQGWGALMVHTNMVTGC